MKNYTQRQSYQIDKTNIALVEAIQAWHRGESLTDSQRDMIEYARSVSFACTLGVLS